MRTCLQLILISIVTGWIGGCTTAPFLRENVDSFNGVKLYGTNGNSFPVGAPGSRDYNAILNLDLTKVAEETGKSMYYFDVILQAGEPIQILEKNSLVIKCDDEIAYFSPSSFASSSLNILIPSANCDLQFD